MSNIAASIVACVVTVRSTYCFGVLLVHHGPNCKTPKYDDAEDGHNRIKHEGSEFEFTWTCPIPIFGFIVPALSSRICLFSSIVHSG